MEIITADPLIGFRYAFVINQEINPNYTEDENG